MFRRTLIDRTISVPEFRFSQLKNKMDSIKELTELQKECDEIIRHAEFDHIKMTDAEVKEIEAMFWTDEARWIGHEITSLSDNDREKSLARARHVYGAKEDQLAFIRNRRAGKSFKDCQDESRRLWF